MFSFSSIVSILLTSEIEIKILVKKHQFLLPKLEIRVPLHDILNFVHFIKIIFYRLVFV